MVVGVCWVPDALSSVPQSNVVETAFELDLILFADGEVAGPDADRHLIELQSRKPAAEFVAKQIRRARDQGRDVEPVLSALAEIPCFGRLGLVQGDPLVHLTRHYAKDYLRHMNQKTSGVDWAEACLRHLQNRPTSP